MLQFSNKKHSYEVCQVSPVCNDKNCQSVKSMCYDKKCQVKSKGTQYSSLGSVSKTASKQIGTQPEITRNIKHSASKSCYPSESTQVSPVSRNYKRQSNHSDSRSSKMQSPYLMSMNPGKMQSNHMQPVKDELQKLQVNTRSQVQTSKYKRDTKTQA